MVCGKYPLSQRNGIIFKCFNILTRVPLHNAVSSLCSKVCDLLSVSKDVFFL